MKKRFLIFLALLVLVVSMTACSENKKIEEITELLADGNYAAVQEIYDKIKQDETFTEVKGLVEEKLSTEVNKLVDSGNYQEAIDYLDSFSADLNAYGDLVEENKVTIGNHVRSLSDDINIASLDEWTFAEAITDQDVLLEKSGFLSEYINNNKDILNNRIASADVFYKASGNADDGRYTEALSVLISEKDSISELTPKFEEKIADVLDSFYEYTTNEVIDCIKTNKIAKIQEVISDFENFDEERAATLKDSTEDLIPETISSLNAEGLYQDSLDVLASVQRELPFMASYAKDETQFVTALLPSMEAYNQGLEQLDEKQYSSSLFFFNKVSPDASYYYNLAVEKTDIANEALHNSNIAAAKASFNKREFDTAIASIDTALEYMHSDSAVALRKNYVAEKALYKEPHEIFAMNKDAVVVITTYDDNGVKAGQGSGFIISSDGKIITNYHVLKYALTAEVKLTDGSVHEVAFVQKYDFDNDFAVIKINATGLSTIKLGNSDNLWSGERVVAIGNPKGMENTISEGLVSSKNRDIEGTTYIQISAPISPGSSGGVLCNLKGQAVGITTAYVLDAQNLNLAIPINIVKPAVSDTSTQMTFDQFANRTDFETIHVNSLVTYEGETKRGVPNGTGTYTHEGYYVYTGDVVNEIFEGEGRMVFEAGAVYEGEFKNDDFNGRGKMTYTNGGVKDGYWEEGYFVGEALDVPKNLISYIPTKSSSVYVGWDKGSFNSFCIYYSFDLITWHAYTEGGSTPKKFTSDEAEINIGRSEAFVYVAVTGFKNGVESKKSEYVGALTLFDELSVYSNDGKNIFLGTISSDSADPNNLLLDSSIYHSYTANNSIFNENGPYGSATSMYSAINPDATKPPVLKNSKGEIVGYLTWNIDFDFDRADMIAIYTSEWLMLMIALGIGL